ncbi:prepilin peptidase [Methylobacterium sp. J-059]|uniref:preprotein translocase subunit SecA n=1 Tax=Methylobacterium sp. J-059 TaxID=2836643 RepID=UPI001FBA2904|nr:prepilin peptidase [Methylobacterium sp. J-059]MCJ2038384.1 prepilin peptidase [Methylobacterium sp. J-059]
MSEAARPPAGALARPILYPERAIRPDGRLERIAARLQGRVRAHLTRVQGRRYARVAAEAEALAPSLAGLDRTALDVRVAAVAAALRVTGRFEGAVLAEAFALIREMSGRVTGQRHYSVQLMGAAALIDGRIAEMATGEGKTLTATLAAGTAALGGLAVHVVTVNDYLAERDAGMMRPLYAALGLTVGVVKSGQEQPERAAAYACDITYCTNKDLAFDYLRDRIALGQRATNLRLKLESLHAARSRLMTLRLRGLDFAIVDEADSVLIDEARTPLIISGQAESQFRPETIALALALAAKLVESRDFVIDITERRILLTAAGVVAVKAAAAEVLAEPGGGAFRNPITCEELVRQALSARHLFLRDEHYLVRDGKVQIIDHYTGRVMPDRAWSDGLHQMIEYKEDCSLSGARTTIARITYQRFFRRYRRLAGMTGTTRGVAAEFWSVYGLAVARIPTHRSLRRLSLADAVLPDQETKWRRAVERIRTLHEKGCPVLVGTRSVVASAVASRHLAEAGLTHTVLSAAQDGEEARIVSEAGLRGRITVATNMAGRGTDIKLGAGVADVGGLHVIMVERHDARRIDDQLAGRSGRQGEPGCFQAILSLDDPLLDGGLLSRGMARRMMPLFGRHAQTFGRLLLRHAQARAERLHARMRADLLRSDQMQDRILAFAGHSE